MEWLPSAFSMGGEFQHHRSHLRCFKNCPRWGLEAGRSYGAHFLAKAKAIQKFSCEHPLQHTETAMQYKLIP